MKDQLKELEEAHILPTHNLFLDCCKAFEEYDKISGFMKFKDVLSYSDANIDELITNVQNQIKARHKEKKRIISFCKEKMKAAERNAEKESIMKIESYKKAEKHTFRDIFSERAQMQDTGRPVDYNKYESKLNGLIVTLKGDLLDIEMSLNQALDSARSAFVSTVKTINEEMHGLQSDCLSSITQEFQVFGTKLKEELNKEKE